MDQIDRIKRLAALFILTAVALNTDNATAANGQTKVASSKDEAAVSVPEPSAQAMQYYRSGNILWAISQFLALAIPAFVLLSGLSVRIRSIAERIGRRWYFVIVAYFALYSLLCYALRLPLDYYAGYVRQHAYGMSNQTFTKWLSDSLTSFAVGIVFGSLVLWIPYWLILRSPRRWWLYTGLLSLPLMFFVMLVEPIWIAPLFNRFGPMRDKQQEAQILALAQRAGIDGGRVFEVEMSADTNAVNAYVTGFAATKRIVLWDTLLKKLNSREVQVVMAHEMGHYVLHHVVWGLLAGFCGIIVALYLVYRLSNVLTRRHKKWFGFDELSSIASLPLLWFLMQAIVLVFMPVGMALSRHIEHEADRFALELTHDNHAMATAFARLQSENLSNPRPGWLYMLWRGSHPSLGERIDFANEYRPWEHGEALQYGDLFRDP